MDKELIFAGIIIILMYVLTQRKVYELSNKILKDTTDELGRPTQKGIILHSLFGGILFYGISFIVRQKRIKQGGDCCCCCSIALRRPSSQRASI